jgi:hypothetical protein
MIGTGNTLTQRMQVHHPALSRGDVLTDLVQLRRNVEVPEIAPDSQDVGVSPVFRPIHDARGNRHPLDRVRVGAGRPLVKEIRPERTAEATDWYPELPCHGWRPAGEDPSASACPRPGTTHDRQSVRQVHAKLPEPRHSMRQAYRCAGSIGTHSGAQRPAAGGEGPEKSAAAQSVGRSKGAVMVKFRSTASTRAAPLSPNPMRSVHPSSVARKPTKSCCTFLSR